MSTDLHAHNLRSRTKRDKNEKLSSTSSFETSESIGQNDTLTTSTSTSSMRGRSSTNGSDAEVGSSSTSNGRIYEMDELLGENRLSEEREETEASPVAVGGAVLQSTVPQWMNMAIMTGLIFGGCCSNVFALEAIVKKEPESGHLITFAQFLLVATEGFIHHFDKNSPTFLRPNQIPIKRWLGVIVLFFSVSVLNNFAFGYNISVPVHIIIRSGGSMTTMALGVILGKKYSRLQIMSVVVLTMGIIVSAMSNAKSMGESEESLSRFLTGLSILFVSQVMAAMMGVYIEGTYEKYGSNWREGLFYTHALSLPLFIPFLGAIHTQYLRLYHSKPLPLPQLLPYLPDSWTSVVIPQQLFYLFVNAVTQYICVRGVNFLSGMSSALTVTIVLNIRKLVSLILSIFLFGNKLSSGVFFGAMIVFGGAFVYGLESQRQGRLRREAAAKSRITNTVHIKD